MAATTVLPRPKQYDDTFFKPISLWLTTTDHKLIGIMYMVTGVLSFVVGGIFALVIRLQLSQPNLKIVDAETYNQLISAHGVTMIFFFVTIFLTGIANYMVPIMIGARDMAFPRVNLLGFWLVPVSIILYYSGFFTGGALDAGWTGYAPLTEKAYQSHSLGVDPRHDRLSVCHALDREDAVPEVVHLVDHSVCPVEPVDRLVGRNAVHDL